MAFRSWFTLAAYAIVALGLLGSTGCGPTQDAGQNVPIEDDHDHDHDHDDHDDHAHGPHGGAVVKLNDQYTAEWVIDDDTDAVKVFILDPEAKKETPIAATKVVITVTAGGQTNTYEIPTAKADAAETSQFVLANAPFELVGALETEKEDEVELKLTVPLGTEEVTVKFEPHHH